MNAVSKFFIVGSGIRESDRVGVKTSRYPRSKKNFLMFIYSSDLFLSMLKSNMS